MSSQSLRYEPDALAPVGCTIRITSDGTVTVHRDHGCSPDDVRDLCEALISGELQIVDLTEPGTPHPRSGVGDPAFRHGPHARRA